MKKIIIFSLLPFLGSGIGYSQSAIDGYRVSQPDMKGTARYMSMAGAFGALGGDLSAISLNPGGIGVYRSSDFGFTVDLDLQSSNSNSMGYKYDMSQTKFLLNNIGAVLTLRLPSETCPNVNFGFTFNRGTTYNRKYGGEIPTLYNSMTNYIAGIANSYGLEESHLATDKYYDPYTNSAVPWLPILGYDGYLITPEVRGGNTNWYGQFGDDTRGQGSFLTEEWGSTSDYNIVIGGNIKNVVFWGMNFNITNLNYSVNSIWGETLQNAYLPDENNNFFQDSSDWNINNVYNVNGTGFQYQIGLIVKPIQELRLGLAFHTPTWYHLTESFGATVNYNYGNGASVGSVTTNNGVLGYNNVNFRTPMKLIASAAGVIGSSLIVSFDYEWTPFNKMHFSEPSGYYGGYYDDWWDYDWGYMSADTRSGKSVLASNDPYFETNQDIANYYQATNTFKIGAEFRINSAFSIRAGYANISSPVKKEAKNNLLDIYTSGTLPSYRFDNSTNYISCGAGYKYQHFYVDLAYVYKHMSSEFHAYTPEIPSNPGQLTYPSPQSSLSFNDSQIVLSAGFRF